MNRDFCTINEIAEKWEVTPRWIRSLCTQGKIPGVVQFGKVWAIPKDAEKPKDGRITTGKYKHWRKKDEDNNMAETQITILGMSGAGKTCYLLGHLSMIFDAKWQNFCARKIPMPMLV